MIDLYIGGAVLTAIYLLHYVPGPRPRGEEWLAFALFVAVWPLLFLWAAYWALLGIME